MAILAILAIMVMLCLTITKIRAVLWVLCVGMKVGTNTRIQHPAGLRYLFKPTIGTSKSKLHLGMITNTVYAYFGGHTEAATDVGREGNVTRMIPPVVYK